MENIRVGLLGCGAMGSALVEGFSKILNSKNIYLYNRTSEKAIHLANKIGANVVENAYDLVNNNCDYIFLAVKPYAIASEMQGLFTGANSRYTGTIISVAAGVSVSDLATCIPSCHDVGVIRLMPNTACLIGEGATGLCCDDSVDEKIIKNVVTLLEQTGLVERVSEKMLDAVTALAGSGIAYGYIFIEALADAGVQFGMTRQQAYKYASQMMVGAGKMVLETESHPAVLKDAVCSPGGITIAALQTLEEKGFRGAIIAAAKTAWETSVKMGKK